MHFLNPGAFWYLYLVPVLLLFTWLNYRRRQFLYQQYCEPALLPKMSRPLPGVRYLWKGLLVSVSAAAIIVALARPCVESRHSEFPKGKTDIVALVDVSRSMAAVDYADKLPETTTHGATRLEMARQLIKKRLIRELQGNQLGIVTYAGEALPLVFLSDDLKPMLWVLDNAMTINSAPGEGSAMVRAFELGLKVFDMDSPPDHDRLLLLFSDGGTDDEAAKLQAIATECAKRGIKVIVLGFGSVNPSPIPVKELAEDDPVAKALLLHGKQWYEENGEVEKTALNENTLRIIAKDAGGKYVRIGTVDDLDILSLAKSFTVTKQAGVEELFFYPLLIGFLAMMAAVAVSRELSSFRRRSP